MTSPGYRIIRPLFWSANEMKQHIMPSLKYTGNEQFINEVMNETNVTAIVEKMATHFCMVIFQLYFLHF